MGWVGQPLLAFLKIVIRRVGAEDPVKESTSSSPKRSSSSFLELVVSFFCFLT